MAAETVRSTPNNSAVYIGKGTKKFSAIIAIELGTDDIVSGGKVVPLMELPQEGIITSIKVMNDTVDSGTDALFDIGIWKSTKGLSIDELAGEDAFEVADQDIYVDGTQELYTANDILTELLGTGDTAASAGTNAVDAADLFTTVRELAGDSTGSTPFKYFLGLKAAVSTVSGKQTGSLLFIVEWIQA